MADDVVELVLIPRHLDRLLEALADAPLIQRHVRRQWWESSAKTGTHTRDPTPSLTSASPTASWTSAATGPAFIDKSLPLAHHISPDSARPSTPPSLSTGDEAEKDALASPTKLEFAYIPPASLLAPPLCSFNATFCNGVTIVDPSVHGSPVRYVSPDFHLGTQPLSVGSCSFFSISYGASVECQLRKDMRRPRGRIMMQIGNRLVERKTGRKSQLLVAEVDVTDAFIKAVTAEFAAHVELPSHSVRSHRPSRPRPDPKFAPEELMFPAAEESLHEPFVDLSELAESMETDIVIARAVETAAYSFSTLDNASCTMQTLTLMADLERLRAQHQNFCVVHASEFHPAHRGQPLIPRSLHVPWISQNWQRDRASPLLPSPRSRALRDQIVDIVAQNLHTTSPFTTRICGYSSDSYVVVTCVPLIEGRRDNDRSGRDIESDDESQLGDDLNEHCADDRDDDAHDVQQTGAWVCFLNAEGAY